MIFMVFVNPSDDMPFDNDLITYFMEILQNEMLPLNPTEIIDKKYSNKIYDIANIYPEEKSLFIDWWDIHKIEEAISWALIREPLLYIPNLEKAIWELCPADSKCNIHARIINFPSYTSMFKLKTTPGKMVCLDVMIRRVKQRYDLCTIGIFKCSRCGFEMHIPQTYPEPMKEPFVCTNENCGRNTGQSTFDLVKASSEFVDAEDITIEDPRDVMIGGEPYQMLVLATNDLTQKVKSGQRIRINGIYSIVQKYKNNKKSLKFGQYIQAHSFENLSSSFDIIKINPKEENEIMEFSKKPDLRHNIRAMIAPFIFGMEDIKEALVLFLFGGVEKYNNKGTHNRGDFHILLIGDPGTGKSQLLKYIAKVSPKGIYTSGKNSTAAGLTATAQKEEDGWVIDAGVLPMADRGVACIDEIDKMREADRDSIHEAMEQQTISGSKAGHVFELQTRCGILAAANPKESRFNNLQSFLEQIDLSPTLFSRFALIFPIQDNIDELIDTSMSDFILDSIADLKDSMDEYDSPNYEEAKEKLQLPMDFDLFIKYIAYAKQNIFPSIPKNIRKKITEYYVDVRQKAKKEQENDEDIRIPLTRRKIEDIARLVEASARLRLSNEANMEDLEHAIKVFKSSMDLVATDKNGRWDVDILETGISSNIRNKLGTFLQTVKNNDKDYPNGVPIEYLKSVLIKGNLMDETEFFKAMDMLLTDGSLFHPGNTHETVKPNYRK